MATIAILMTCHNRRETTRTCLVSLKVQTLPSTASLELWVVDDGSKDGTNDMIREEWPGATLLKGDGSLYWCGGMRLAWASALERNPDLLLLLNDDVELYPTAIRNLWETRQQAIDHGHGEIIVVGSCREPAAETYAYGGRRRLGRHPGRVVPVQPTGRPQECDTFDGNCVLIPRCVYQSVGELGRFRHAMADSDYGYRARRADYRIEVSPGYVGTCAERHRNLDEREDVPPWGEFVGPKGLPMRDWAVFLQRHSGPEWPVYWGWTYLRWAYRRLRQRMRELHRQDPGGE